MTFFTEITDRISAMRELVGDVALAGELPHASTNSAANRSSICSARPPTSST